MPAKLDKETRGEIVRLRALDYDKQEIANRLDVSRNTVSRHLQDVQQEARESEDPDAVLLNTIAAGIFGASIGYAAAKILKGALEEIDEEGQQPELQTADVQIEQNDIS